MSYPSDYNTLLVTTEDGSKSGAFPSFMNRVFQELQMRTEVVEISEAALDAFPKSDYTACAYDVALNRTGEQGLSLSHRHVSCENVNLTLEVPCSIHKFG